MWIISLNPIPRWTSGILCKITRKAETEKRIRRTGKADRLISKARRAEFALFLVVVVWGATFVSVQKAIEEIPVHSFHVLRFGVASVILLPLLLLRRMRQKQPAKGDPRILWKAGLLTGLSLWLGYTCQTTGLLYTTPAHSGFLTGLSVVVVPPLALLFLKEKMNRDVITGVLLAAAGLGLMTFGGEAQLADPPANLDIVRGDMISFGCTIAFAFQIIFKARYASKLSALALTTVEIGTVFVLSVIAALTLEEIPDYSNLSMTVWGAVALTGVLATAAAFLIQTWAQKSTTAVSTAVVFAMEPVMAALFSWWLIGELLSWTAATGGVLMIAGMLVAELGLPGKKPDTQA